ncbi:MAG TPA: DUF6580 family putative transport protein [Chitinophagaceae bacterium]
MKFSKNFLLVFLLLIVVAALYRVIPGRPLGFAPHLAMALFGGAVIKDKKWAFALPVFSLFISDLLYQFLYSNGLSDTPGFYEGQWLNYLWFVAITCLGFTMRNFKAGNIISYSFLTPTVYFLLSNFSVWIGGGGLQRPKTFGGLMQCYIDGLPFYRGAILATVVFSALFFGTYFLANRNKSVEQPLKA